MTTGWKQEHSPNLSPSVPPTAGRGGLQEALCDPLGGSPSPAPGALVRVLLCSDLVPISHPTS